MATQNFIASLNKQSQPQDYTQAFKRSGERIRGSSNIPLNHEGRMQAIKLAQRTVGQFNRIYTSHLDRTHETAEILHATNPQVKRVEVTPNLNPWRLGGLEGKPVEDALPEVKRLVVHNPDEAPAGQGPESTMPGESFNHFHTRVIHALKQMKAAVPEGKSDVAVTHYRDIHLLKSFLAAGGRDTPDIDKQMFHEESDVEPGHLYRWNDNDTVTPAKDASIPGFYLARHGSTAWNKGDQKVAS